MQSRSGLKIGDIKPLIWECKKQTVPSFKDLNYRHLCFAILNAVKVYQSKYGNLPKRLCGILSSGRMFVLIQARRDAISLEMKWERTQKVNLFNNVGVVSDTKCEELEDMISHGFAVAKEISNSYIQPDKPVTKDDVDRRDTGYREEEEEKEDEGRPSTTGRQSAQVVSKSVKQGNGGKSKIVATQRSLSVKL